MCPRRRSGDALIESGAQEGDAARQLASTRRAPLSLTSREARLPTDMMDELDAIIQNAEGPENSVDIQTTLIGVAIQARNFATSRVVPARGQVFSVLAVVL